MFSHKEIYKVFHINYTTYHMKSQDLHLALVNKKKTKPFGWSFYLV